MNKRQKRKQLKREKKQVLQSDSVLTKMAVEQLGFAKELVEQVNEV